MAEGLQKRLQSELEKYKATQSEFQKCAGTRQKLEAQLNENSMVKDELDRLESDAKVFKMMGPVLMKQDLEEGKQTVGKRIDYINGEIKRQISTTKDLEKKLEAQQETLEKLQQQFQFAQVKAAAKA